MRDLVTSLSERLKILNFETSVKKNGFHFHGVPRSANSYLASALYKTLKKDILVVLPTNTDAENFYKELFSFLKRDEILFLPGNESIPYEYAKVPLEIKRDRTRTLTSILENKAHLVIASVSGILQLVPEKNYFSKNSIKLTVDEEYDQETILRTLVDLGYEREVICETYGTFSAKGGIIDIFPSTRSNPIRLDFFGDTLESIKIFDPESQRSLESVSKVIIHTSSEYILLEEEKNTYEKKIQEFPKDLHRPTELNHFSEELVSLARKQTGLLNYFKVIPEFIFIEQNLVTEKILIIEREFDSLYNKRKEEIICIPKENLLSRNLEREILFSKSGFHVSALHKKCEKENEVELEWKEAKSFLGKIREVRDDALKLLSSSDTRILITSSFQAQTERLKGLFEKENIQLLTENPQDLEPFSIPKKSGLYLALSELRNGFQLPEESLYVWTDNDIFGRSYKRKTRFKNKASSAIQSFIDLREGDYIVHVHHGVGKFIKIEKQESEGKIRDFLKLEYSEGATLFVPLDQISLVQRYIGGTDKPSLDSLGKSNWKKKLEKAKGSVSRLAEEFLVMYMNRMKLQGYAFPKDTIWQEEFEAEFEYEETPDQLAAIEAVKRDLESPRPMDRLVCGDVGYGKTEVAIRAAFKTIIAGKQVLFVAPTTILALQHYNTLTLRYQNYPIKLEMVSRFRTQKEVRESLQKFSNGELDLLVGTHALLTPNMKPKNLGLLIIDEEQRFGVNQKETVKKWKNLVDVLTLTATPIPRTLHMSLTGIRDLSVIETPPKNRQSVETYVTEESDEIIVSAIERELEREGQVFYLHNRVESIEKEADRIAKLLPRVGIGILHGQMTEDEVEERIMDFNSRKYDVLVTTSIIESGIDMPNVNTILVNRADTFGLSQLYQIRGRVGRSGRQAYAYLFYPRDRSLTEQAEKRLNTIYEYQELGSGFKVAMRDLEIRGAGNLLGNEQSGNIIDIGFDLYVKLLTEEVSKLKSEKIEVEVRTALNLQTDFYIPETYIHDTKQKIEFYKKFEGASSEEEVKELAEEMKDRFGNLPESVETFIRLEIVRVLASKLGFEVITGGKEEIRFKVGNYFSGDPKLIIKLMSEPNSNFSMSPNEPNVLKLFPKSKSDTARIEEVIKILKRITPKH
ncbi:MAG: transcription-repair coupling factor [Leptospiraceae bacterium]|nr:transcription-repair coupling factor [Leptospiraceae bacterium]